MGCTPGGMLCVRDLGPGQSQAAPLAGWGHLVVPLLRKHAMLTLLVCVIATEPTVPWHLPWESRIEVLLQWGGDLVDS